MTGALAPPCSSTTVQPLVRPLAIEDIPALRLPGRQSSEAMREALTRNPDRSVWVPETLEYALIGTWRHRPDIANVDELVAVRNVEPLLRSALKSSIEFGAELLLAIELETHRGTSRFERAGMERLEEVITYEFDLASVRGSPSQRFGFTRIRERDAVSIARVTSLDQVAFPWLWRNSRREFEIYISTPGVVVSMLEVDGVPVAYVGTTLFSGWGHLDRIAVEPQLQGRGYGRDALAFAIDSLRRQGARRIGLSTQGTNTRSQRLYERFGFARTPELDYQLFGFWRPEPGIVPNWDR